MHCSLLGWITCLEREALDGFESVDAAEKQAFQGGGGGLIEIRVGVFKVLQKRAKLLQGRGIEWSRHGVQFGQMPSGAQSGSGDPR